MIITNHSLYECYKYMHKYLNSSGGQRWLAQVLLDLGLGSIMSKDRTPNDRVERSLLENSHFGVEIECYMRFQNQGSW